MFEMFSMTDIRDAEYKKKYNVLELSMRCKIFIFTHLYASLTKQTTV